MSAQRTRINVVSANIANAKTTHTAEGGPYKKQQVIFEDVLLASGKKPNANDVESSNNKNSDLSLRGVGVKSILQSDAKPVLRYEPSNPDADEKGYVAAVSGDNAPGVKVGDLIVAVDPRYFRPSEVETLLGDPTKAKEKLGWVPETTLQTMVEEMVQSDLAESKKHALLKLHGFDVSLSLE